MTATCLRPSRDQLWDICFFISVHVMAQVWSDEDVIRQLVCRQVRCECSVWPRVHFAKLVVLSRRVAGHILKKDEWVVLRCIWEAADDGTLAGFGVYVLLVSHPRDSSGFFNLRHQM